MFLILLNCFCIGFRGKTCNDNIDECAASPCGGGSCIDGINKYTCNCNGSGYNGPTCSSDIDECNTNNPCHPNATCINHAGTYQCDCQAGFNGKNCYQNIDDCRSNPCQNGGMQYSQLPQEPQTINLQILLTVLHIFLSTNWENLF